MPYYAHTATLPDGTPAPLEKWQLLEDHLAQVAEQATRFGSVFGATEWTRLIGRWHDLGKYSQEFQDYLRAASGVDAHLEERETVASKVDHSTAGAQLADRSLPTIGRLMAYLIAGHHAGLPNGMDATESTDLERRLQKSIPDYSAAPAALTCPPSLDSLRPPAFALRHGYATAFFLRMVFSCLVDADFLDTESFMSRDKAAKRPRNPPSVAELVDCLNTYLATFGKPQTSVQHDRAGVLAACRSAAEHPVGLFTLTVPTGGGKTLSSLAFALEHARRHGLERVIYVIPFTSIIEQNAGVFRDVFAPLGPDIVLEHHSNLDPEARHATATSRLAAENWDARIIVTTNVQFFESLHARETSRCRKLHRLARSVIILDEAQTLPVGLLQPCLRSLEELSSHYGSSIVLCTATQPAINRRTEFPIGLPEPREIIPEPTRLYETMRRVTVRDLGPMPDADLASRLAGHPQVLCIVNTRRHAAELYALLSKSEGSLHLSALMCPEHRSEVIQAIRQRLKTGEPCRVVSTQLIEAGVDLDFPVVYRALAGLDSIAQAAGRCNREGKQAAGGQTFVFTPPEHPAPAGFLRDTAQSAAEVLPLHADDPLSLAAVRRYFELHYWKNTSATDVKRILDCWPREQPRRSEDLFGYQFRTCSESFRFIDSAYQPVIVPWGERGRALCEELRHIYDPAAQRRLARKLQRFIVQIPEKLHRAELGRRIQMVHERFPLLVSPLDYSSTLGLQIAADLPYDPIAIIS